VTQTDQQNSKVNYPLRQPIVANSASGCWKNIVYAGKADSALPFFLVFDQTGFPDI